MGPLLCKAAYSSSYTEWAAIEHSLGEDDALTDAGLGKGWKGPAHLSQAIDAACSVDPDPLFSLHKGQGWPALPCPQVTCQTSQ